MFYSCYPDCEYIKKRDYFCGVTIIMKGRKHKLKVRLRAFHIWQLLGYSPWKSEWTVPGDAQEGNVKGFYKGAFDSIPFLNDDAKRTFVHLLLRPGYMIRDYIKGKHDMYLAPLTSLIIFYAFFSLVSSIAHPDFNDKNADTVAVADSISINEAVVKLDLTAEDSVRMAQMEANMNVKMKKAVEYGHAVIDLLYLDQNPENIDSPRKASLAAFEDAIRSQGIHYFLEIFLILWPAMRISLRKRSIGWAASATTAAYVLCQFSFFMLFVLILSLGKDNEIGILFMGLLIMIDYHQMLGIGYRKSFWLTVKTGFWYLFLIILLILLAIILLSIWVAI